MADWNLESDYLSNMAAVLLNTRPILRGGDDEDGGDADQQWKGVEQKLF